MTVTAKNEFDWLPLLTKQQHFSRLCSGDLIVLTSGFVLTVLNSQSYADFMFNFDINQAHSRDKLKFLEMPNYWQFSVYVTINDALWCISPYTIKSSIITTKTDKIIDKIVTKKNIIEFNT